MSRLLIRKRLNNKGNTLVVVLIGIFVLSILGTLILGLTATNYKMKVVEKKSEDTFYYAEKALDEVYAGIGGEVMKTAKASYEDVLGNFIEDVPGGNYQTISAADATAKFKDYYLNGKSSGGVVITGITEYYPETVTAVDSAMISRLESYITSVNGYSIEIDESYVDPDTHDGTTVNYYNNAAGELEEVIIRNLCVKSTTGANGYYSSVVTDFRITIPSVNFNIIDNQVQVTNNVDDISKYSLIAQGVGSHSDQNADSAAILVKGDSFVTTDVKINANIFAGHGDIGNTDRTLKAIQVNANQSLEVLAENCVCDGPVVIAGGKAYFKGQHADIANKSYNDAVYDATKNPLNLYATDIITEKNGAKLNIVGNMIVSDDLEVNGDASEIGLKGQYFGYGFQADGITDIRDSNKGVNDPTNPIKEAANGSVDTGFVNFGPGSVLKYEHEKRSAIIVNGKSANLDFTGLKTLILGGRAYIDLDTGMQAYNASYMTGESVSFKGSQDLYKAGDTELLGSSITADKNPIDYQTLVSGSNLDTSGELSYSTLGLNPDLVVAKKIDDKVYFYKKELNPKDQTNGFYKTIASGNQKAQDNVKSLDVKNLAFSNTLNYFTVGAFMSVRDGKLTVVSGKNDGYNYSATMNGKFCNYIREMMMRKDYMMNKLTPLTSIAANSPVRSVYDLPKPEAATETIFDQYIEIDRTAGAYNSPTKKDMFNENTVKVVYNGVEKTVAEHISDITGKTYDPSNPYYVGYQIDFNNGSSPVNLELDEGIFVSEGPVTIKDDFKGIIITKGKITIYGSDIEISANEELIKFMLTCEDNGYFKDIRKAFKLNVAPETTSSIGIESNGITYHDVVGKENWKKNYN